MCVCVCVVVVVVVILYWNIQREYPTGSWPSYVIPQVLKALSFRPLSDYVYSTQLIGCQKSHLYVRCVHTAHTGPRFPRIKVRYSKQSTVDPRRDAKTHERHVYCAFYTPLAFAFSVYDECLIFPPRFARYHDDIQENAR